MESFSRRNFLKGAAILGAGFAAEIAGIPILTQPVQATDYIEPIPTTTEVPFDEHNFQFTSLKQWREYLEPEKEALRPIIYNIDLYQGIRGLTLDNQIEDFELYWEFWRMGERMHWVPAALLWQIHIGETNVSTHKYPDKDRFNRGRVSRGAMQIWQGNLVNPIYQQALEDIRNQAGFLADITEARYIAGLPANGDGSICEYSDWEIIPLAAFFILYHTPRYLKQNPTLSPVDAFKEVVKYDYSLDRGPLDVKNFERFTEALQPALNSVIYTPPKVAPTLNSPLAF